jgi:hypothetical protein
LKKAGPLLKTGMVHERKKNKIKETGTGKLKKMSYEDLVQSNKARKTTQ